MNYHQKIHLLNLSQIKLMSILIPITLIKLSILLVKITYFFVVNFVKGTTYVDSPVSTTKLVTKNKALTYVRALIE